MNKAIQERQIRRFLRGKAKKDVDAFCIYQWIERCHFEEWWEMGVALGSQLQPNSLNRDYEKRLDFILLECRRNDEREKKAQNVTIGEIIDSFDGTEKDELLKQFKMYIPSTMKWMDILRVPQGRPSASESIEDVHYSFPTHKKETSPIHYINYLVYEENIQYFDEVARKLSMKFHNGNLKKSKQLLYNHARHRGIQLK
jgi:hypothetical protein